MAFNKNVNSKILFTFDYWTLRDQTRVKIELHYYFSKSNYPLFDIFALQSFDNVTNNF